MSTTRSMLDNTLVVFADGSYDCRGSGAGVILKNNYGLMIKVSLRFKFSTTNNQAEYDTVIAGISLVKEIGAECHKLRKKILN